ncbi:NAD(P)H-hydrate dehydratase [Opitutales bacterium ASA1]|uniref:NAD(P)H-hydrate dehydratase n=1 Tax=Congregicoccus parvus TaxID=3081749 RepID=UPI002B2FA036|nr:NAD(P)H-hydrate dehydratase [Opitutales bacterium ASA1]
MIGRVRIPGARPVLSCADASAFEQGLFGGDPAREWPAMRRAGRAVGRAVLADLEEPGGASNPLEMLVLCGKGHNGGDALLATIHVLDTRPAARADVLVVPDFSALRPLARRCVEELQRAHGERVRWMCVSGREDGTDAARVRAQCRSRRYDLCLDGIHGMQFRPPLRDPVGWLLGLVADHTAIRLRAAIDLPSGIGDASDPDAFRADFTYATGVAKAPLFDPANRDRLGRVRFLDLGFFEGRENPGVDNAGRFVLGPEVVRDLGALRQAHADKRTFGHLFVVSGSRDMPGAVMMSVESALCSGVGLVTAFVPEGMATAAAARLPEAMWVPMPETPGGGLALEGRAAVVARATRCTALLVGPGLGRDRETRVLVRELLEAIDVPTVLDGDALQPDLVRARRTAPLVLTPHAGELARIAEGSAHATDEDLLSICASIGATIVAKGAPTRIANSDTIWISPHGGPVLARGGSGDVLAGLVAGLLATGTEPVLASCRGTVWHGLAADALARRGGSSSVRLTRITKHLAEVLREASREVGHE